jgi:hypothetical protein
MCIIVDVNVAHKVFLTNDDPDLGYIRWAIDRRAARAVYGGELGREYRRNLSLSLKLLEYDREGKARKIDNALVDAETTVVRNLNLCKSNDEHIIALARVASVRLVCTDDEALHKDFRNVALLADPRGNVFRRASHKHLIKKHCSG